MGTNQVVLACSAQGHPGRVAGTEMVHRPGCTGVLCKGGASGVAGAEAGGRLGVPWDVLHRDYPGGAAGTIAGISQEVLGQSALGVP